LGIGQDGSTRHDSSMPKQTRSNWETRPRRCLAQ
jgi:hypothetical protein